MKIELLINVLYCHNKKKIELIKKERSYEYNERQKKKTQSLSFPKTIVRFLYLKILYQLGYVPSTLHGQKLFIVSNKSKITDVMPSREVGTI